MGIGNRQSRGKVAAVCGMLSVIYHFLFKWVAQGKKTWALWLIWSRKLNITTCYWRRWVSGSIWRMQMEKSCISKWVPCWHLCAEGPEGKGCLQGYSKSWREVWLSVVGWLHWLPNTHPAALAFPLLNRTGRENMMKKLVDQVKDGEIAYQ